MTGGEYHNARTADELDAFVRNREREREAILGAYDCNQESNSDLYDCRTDLNSDAYSFMQEVASRESNAGRSRAMYAFAQDVHSYNIDVKQNAFGEGLNRNQRILDELDEVNERVKRRYGK